jgi:predicted permease
MALQECLQDVGYGWRQFARTPVVTVIVVLTLAIGVGAQTAIFSLLDTALFQTLPVQYPGQLRTVVVISRSGAEMSNVPAEFFEELRRAPQSFSGVFAFWRMKVNFDAGGDSDRLLLQMVSGQYYATLGVSAFLGRTISDADEQSQEKVAVLSHAFWMLRFGGDPEVIGRTVNIEGIPVVIVGVTPPGFFGTDQGISPEVTVPFDASARFANVWAMVRLKPDASEKQAQAEAEVALQRAMETIRPRLSKYREKDRQAILTQRAALRPGDAGLGLALSPYTQPLRILILLSGVVLLIACVNIANLLVARSVARAHEFRMRLALGAGRWRLVRQLLTECAMLSLAGAVAGVALAVWMQRLLVLLLMEPTNQLAIEFTLNSHVLAFSAGMALLTLLLFGAVTALRGTPMDVLSLVKRETSGSRVLRLGLTKSLMVGQVAASLVLLCGAGLLVRSFQNLQRLDTGVNVENMLAMRIALNPREYQRSQIAAVYQRLKERAAAVPGVTSVALGWDFAFSSGTAGKSIWVEGQPPEESQGAGFNVVGPDFFSTAGIPVLLGREFSIRDTLDAPKVVIINEALARRYFLDQNPIGRHLGDEGAKSIGKYEVIGVVQDSRNMPLRRDPGPVLYQPLLQDEWASSVVLHVRTRSDPRLVLSAVRTEIRAINPKLPVYDITTLSERRSLALHQDRMMATLAGFFGMLALLLTAVGVYAVLAYAVGRRTVEIGVRMALGATRAGVLWMVVRETLTVVAAGVALGIPISLASGKVLKAMLFGVKPQDTFTVVFCAGVLLAAGLVAGFLPARRAARVDPMAALRTE